MRRDSIKVLRRGGRIRLRSAGSQLPAERSQANWQWVPYRKLKGLLPYLVAMLVLCVVIQTGYTRGVFGTWQQRVPRRVEVWSVGNNSTRKASMTVAQLISPPPRHVRAGKRLLHPAVGVIPPPPAHPRDETPNEVLLKTAVVLTNVQTSCRLREVAERIHKDYPNIPVIIEKSNITGSFCKGVGTDRHVHCYSSSCRWGGCISNRFISSTLRRHPDILYFFLWDAQFEYMESHSLLHVVKQYMESDVEVVSPCIKDMCNLTTGALHKPAGGGKLTAIPGVQTHFNSSAAGCVGSELFSPVFFTSRQTLDKLLWDEEAVGCQHTDLMLYAREKRLKAAVCRDIQVSHQTCSDLKEKSSTFTENWLYLAAPMFRKWNLTHVHNGLGRVFRPASNKVTYSDVQWTRVDNSLVADSSSIDHVLHNAAIDDINDRSAGWDYVRPVEGKETELDYMRTSSCVTRVKGQLHVEYDRHGSFQNKQFVLKVDMHKYDRSCPLFKDYWTVLGSGMLEKKHVYYVSAVSNETAYMGRLLQRIDSQYDLTHTHLVIVDMSRRGDEQFNISAFNTRVTVHYVYLGAPFSRSIGLKRGFDHAIKEANLLGHSDPILFSIDATMIIPEDFTERIQKSTRCGVSAYAPICYKETWEGGYWVTFGYGMVGVCASDYTRTDGWDDRWGYHWGAEDVDFIHRLQDSLPYIVRTKESHYKHSRLEVTGINSRNYYTNKNIYPGQLPVTPSTRLVTDQTVTESLHKYAVTQTNMKDLQLSAVYQTPLTSGYIYDLRLSDSDEEFYVLVRSI